MGHVYNCVQIFEFSDNIYLRSYGSRDDGCMPAQDRVTCVYKTSMCKSDLCVYKTDVYVTFDRTAWCEQGNMLNN